MARITEPAPEQEAAYRQWVSERPANVRAVAEQFDPWSLYRMKSTGHRVTVVSFGETQSGRVTLTVLVSGRYNFVTLERQVFGIAPDDLEPCDLPGAEERVGSLLTPEEVMENLDQVRLLVRPDLWEKGPDGKARWKGTN